MRLALLIFLVTATTAHEINLQLDQARGELFACQRRLNESGIRDGG